MTDATETDPLAEYLRECPGDHLEPVERDIRLASMRYVAWFVAGPQ